MLGITSFATVISLMGGLGVQMNAYLANISDAADVKNTAAIERLTKVDQPVTLESAVREYFSDEPVLAEVARCESTFRQFDSSGHVVRGEADSNDVGIMQINERYHLERARALGYDIYTLQGNMAYARYLYEMEGTKPWKASKPCWSASVAKIQLAQK